jgi:tripartite-type tricarboxylate transporter receptor subunit TctC
MTTALSAAPAAMAEDYPNRPIRVIVPYPPGQASDQIVRLVGQHVSEALKQPVIVENRAGASGNIGTELGARAANDGYTLTLATAALPISANIYTKLPFNPLKDFEPVTLMTVMPLVLIANPGAHVNTVSELVSTAKKDPGKMTVASSGPGTSHHLSGELFKSLAGIDMLHVPYKGSSAAHIDLMGGRVDVMFDNIVAVQNNVRENKLKALAVTTKTRAPSLPQTPTMAESGFPNFEAVAWFGIMAPAGTSKPIIDTLNLAFRNALADPKIKERLGNMGAQVQTGTPQEFGTFMAAEVAKWKPVVAQANIRMD